MRYVELMKENFALTCCRNRASQTQTVGRTNIVNRLPVSIPEATTSPGQNGFRRLRRWRTLSGLNQPAAGIVAGPFGLIISYSIAAGVIEGKLIPELNNRLKAVQNFFTSLSATVKQANKDIDAAKLKLATEIAAIGEIKTETETTRFYVDYDDLMLSLLKGAAKKMINTCNEYQQRHGKKTLLEVPDV